MRLLTKREVTRKLRNRDVFDKIRNDKAIENSKKSLVYVVDDVNNKKKELQQDFDNFFSGINQKKEKLLIEVGVLRSKKTALLEPLDKWESELYDKQEELDMKERDIKDSREALRIIKANLNEREDKINLSNTESEESKKHALRALSEIVIRENALKPEEKKIEGFRLRSIQILEKKKIKVEEKILKLATDKEQIKLDKDLIEKANEQLIKDRKRFDSQQQSLKAIYASTQFKNYIRHSGSKN